MKNGNNESRGNGFQWMAAEYVNNVEGIVNDEAKMVKSGATVMCIAAILGSTVALAIMGLVFCWGCPEWLPVVGVNPRVVFIRQLVWNAIGVSAFGLAAMFGWKRWLKYAPFVAIGWLVACAAAFHCPSVNGDVMLWLGPIRIDIFTFLPLVSALMLAWLSEKLKIRAFPLLICTSIALLAVVSVKIVTNPSRIARLAMFFGGELSEEASRVQSAAACMQEQCRMAIESAHWFSGNVANLMDIPGRRTFAMSASAALLFGKWFVAVVCLLFGALACGVSYCFVGTKDEAKRSFAIVTGVGILGMAATSYLGCLGVVPMVYKPVPLVSFGGVLAVMTWISVGVLISMLKDGGVALPSKWHGVAVAATCGAGTVALVALMGG